MPKISKTHLFSLGIFLLALLPLFLVTTPLFLKDPPVWPDEAIYTDMAKNLLATGNLATDIFGETIPGLSVRAFWYPPLYFYLLAFWIKIFGPSIEAVRMLSLIFAFASVMSLFWVVKVLFRSNLLALVGAILLTLDPWFIQAAKVARMDMFSFLLLMLSILTFFLAQKKGKFYFLPGIFCGLGILTHPLGFIAPTLFLLFMLLQKIEFKDKFFRICSIFTPVIFSFLLWLWMLKEDLSLFVIQYQLQFARKSASLPYVFFLLKGADPFWKIFFAAHFLIALILFIQLVRFRNRITFFLLLGLGVSTITIFWGKEMWYPLYFQPFITLAFLSCLTFVKGKAPTANHWKGDGFFALLFFFVILELGYSVGNTERFTGQNYDYHDFTRRISANLPFNAKVFLATIPDPYFDLQANKNIKLYEFPTVPTSKRAYRDLLASVDYVILNMPPHPVLIDYLEKNTESEIKIEQPVGYSTSIFRLKKERTALEF
ncbi:MAG: glycosyltransferase family 39 protein [bacterium]|nr:glycosyltransferase family 39 protein [bacterium]